MLYNTKAQANIIAAPHIALTPIVNVNRPPKNDPNKNDITIIKRRIVRTAASLSFLINAIYASLEADRKFPVDMVELYGESASLGNEDT